MSKVVLDTSAVLAYLFDEKGTEQVEQLLEHSTCLISSVNYAELVSKLVDKGMPLADAIAAIDNLELEFRVQDKPQAELNADLRPISKPFGLSLGDRACLALGMIENLPVVTADRIWEKLPSTISVKVIR
jgi:PIN domain nuclease of toxin-antitoxin system